MRDQQYEDIFQIGVACGIIGTYTPRLKRPLISAIKQSHCQCFIVRIGLTEDMPLLQLMKNLIEESPLMRLCIFYNKHQLLYLPFSDRLFCESMLRSADYRFEFPWQPNELFENIAVYSQMLIALNKEQNPKVMSTIEKLKLSEKIIWL